MPADPRWLSGSHLERFALVLLLVLPAIVFANTLDNGYHLDDEYRIVGNLELEKVWPPWRHFFDASTGSTLRQLGHHYRPLLPLSLSVNHWLSDTAGLDRLAGLHIGNILIHCVTAALLFWLFCSLLEFLEAPGDSDTRARAGLLAASIFAIHPVAGVPVNYLSKRDILMMALLSIAALLVYVTMRLRGRGSIGAMAAFGLLFGLALTAREEAVAVLPICIVLELIAPPRRRDHWRRPAIAGLTTVLAMVTAAGLLAQPWLPKKLSLDYAATQLGVHLRYLADLFWPFPVRLLPRVSPVEGYLDTRAWAGLLLVVGSLYLAWRWRRALPAASFCIVSYWAFVAPSSSFLELKELAAPYRLYPSLAFFFLLLVLLALQRMRPALVFSVGSALALLLAGTSVAMNGVWKDALTMGAQHARYGGTATAHLNYARGLWAVDPQRTGENLRIAVELEPENIYVRINLGLFRLQRGDVEGGLADVVEAVRLAPREAITWHWLASAYRQAGRPDDALMPTLRAAKLAPDNVEYQYSAAIELQKHGDVAASIDYLRRVERLFPDYQDTRLLLARALERTDSEPPTR